MDAFVYQDSRRSGNPSLDQAIPLGLGPDGALGLPGLRSGALARDRSSGALEHFVDKDSDSQRSNNRLAVGVVTS